MDFKGQELAEYYFYYIMVILSTIGFFIGHYFQNFTLTFQIWFSSLILALLTSAPDWPMYNRNPVNWLKAVGDGVGRIKSVGPGPRSVVNGDGDGMVQGKNGNVNTNDELGGDSEVMKGKQNKAAKMKKDKSVKTDVGEEKGMKTKKIKS